MFGLSSEDRRRLDRAAESAAQALTKLEAHEIRCTDRYGELHRAVVERRAFMTKLMWLLVTCVAGILMLIVKEAMVNGLAHP